MKKCELGNGKKRIKHLELVVNQIFIHSTTVAWEAKLNDFMVEADSHSPFCGVGQSCSCGIAAQLFPSSAVSFPFQLAPLVPEEQFRGKPSLLMQFLTAARSCSTGGWCENFLFVCSFLSFFPLYISLIMKIKYVMLPARKRLWKTFLQLLFKKIHFRWKCVRKFKDACKTVLFCNMDAIKRK